MGSLSACRRLAAELITRDLVNNQRRVGYHAFDEPRGIRPTRSMLRKEMESELAFIGAGCEESPPPLQCALSIPPSTEIKVFSFLRA
jgi:hypothetical protein